MHGANSGADSQLMARHAACQVMPDLHVFPL